jgi:hypothetical protein
MVSYETGRKPSLMLALECFKSLFHIGQIVSKCLMFRHQEPNAGAERPAHNLINGTHADSGPLQRLVGRLVNHKMRFFQHHLTYAILP